MTPYTIKKNPRIESIKDKLLAAAELRSALELKGR